MSFFRKIEISLGIALLTSIIFSIISFAQTSEEIRNDVLRLHVLANSDSVTDQNLKIAVRDAILSEGAELFNGSVTKDNAVEKIIPELDRLKLTAEQVISERGFDYCVSVELTEEYFETRTYDDITLPAGEYLSLIIRIGKAQGKNWWCVMFPPMCVSAADKADELNNFFNKNEINLVSKNPKYEPRFKIIEIYESIKDKFKN